MKTSEKPKMLQPSVSGMSGGAAGAMFTFVDLFAGIGGFHAVASALGGVCVYAVENDPYAAAVYERNWDVNPLGDITVDVNDTTMRVPAHDVLFAGFPCQPFSKSGAQKGMDETRGTLYWNILTVIQQRQPAVVVLENVRNLTGPRHRHEWRIIIDTLRDAGYRVSEIPAIFSPHLLHPEYGGRPQMRERVYITATRLPDGWELETSDGAVSPAVTHIPVAPEDEWTPSLWNITDGIPLETGVRHEKAMLSEPEKLWIDAWNEFVILMRNVDGGIVPKFPLWVDHWTPVDKLTIPDNTPVWKKHVLQKNSSFYTTHSTTLNAWIRKWGVTGDTFPPSRRKLEWQAQDTPTLWECILQFRPSGIRAKKPTYVPALVAITQTSIIGPEKRRLTPREGARLQGLPEWFDFGDQPDTRTFRQLGNGVSIGAVWYVLRQHCERDADLLKHTHPDLLHATLTAPHSPDAVLAHRCANSGKVITTTQEHVPTQTSQRCGSPKKCTKQMRQFGR